MRDSIENLNNNKVLLFRRLIAKLAILMRKLTHTQNGGYKYIQGRKVGEKNNNRKFSFSSYSIPYKHKAKAIG